MTRPAILFVHGAANSSGVWRFWREHVESRGHRAVAPDLRGHGNAPCDDLSPVLMIDYVEDVRRAAAPLPAPPVVVGWSMGGLVALMYAVGHPVAGVIALGPSTPGQLLPAPSSEPLTPGTFGPEVYGIADPTALRQPTMPDLDEEEVGIALASLGPESAMARQDRKRGIPIDRARLGGPALVVAGERDETCPPATCHEVARFLGAAYVEFTGASHWGLVLNRRALDTHLPEVLGWLDRLRPVPPPSPR